MASVTDSPRVGTAISIACSLAGADSASSSVALPAVSAVAAFAAAALAGAGAAAAGADLAEAFSSRVARRASVATVWPSLATISVRTPAAGAGTSTVTLSVSSSQSISSTLTASPTFLNQVATVASVTLSPRVGTRMSVMVSAVLPEGQRLVDEGRLLGLVFPGEAGRGRGRGGAADVGGPAVLRFDAAEDPFEVGLDEAPAALVLGLFLAPDDLGLLEAAELLGEARGRGTGRTARGASGRRRLCRGRRAPRGGRSRPCPST